MRAETDVEGPFKGLLRFHVPHSTIDMACHSERQIDDMEAAELELGSKVWEMLYQAKCIISGRTDNDDWVANGFIERAENILGIRKGVDNE